MVARTLGEAAAEAASSDRSKPDDCEPPVSAGESREGAMRKGSGRGV